MVPLIKGELTLRVRCLTPEKLLERAIAQGAVFAEVRRSDPRTLVVRCDTVSAGILHGLCERFSIPVEVLRRGGATALAGFAARRATLPLGLALCVALCVLFLGRIWLVDIAVTGESAAQSRNAIRAVLDERGIRPGASRNVDVELLASAIEAEVPGLSHVSASLHGIRLLVDAAGEEPVPGLYDIDAARALGLPYHLMMWEIIIPQALRSVAPALVNEVITVLKSSSLVATIGLMDMMRAAQSVQALTYRAFEPFIAVAAIYYVIVMVLVAVSRRLERRLKQN